MVVSNGCAPDATSSPALLTVNKKGLTVTASNRTKTYGDAVTLAGTEFTTTGLVNSDAVSGVTLTSTGAAATATVAGSTYAIVASVATGTGLANYSISYVDGALTVTSKSATITASNRTKTYGDVVTFAGTEFTTAGLVNSDAVSGVTLTSTGSAATATIAGSTYPIVASAATGTGLANYNISYVDGALTVDSKALEVIANSDSKEYGSGYIFAGTEFTTVGEVNGDGVDSATITSAGSDATAGVANYDINISEAVGTGLGNYTINYTKGNLEVTKKALEVIANSDSKQYGSGYTFAGTEFTTVGEVNGDGVDSATITSAGSDATAGVANYDINISEAVGTGLGNYTITYTKGNLEVTKKDLTVTSKNQSKFCGQTITFMGTEFTQVGLVNEDVISSATIVSFGAASSASAIGSPYVINISDAIGTGLSNYNINYATGGLIVKPVSLDLTDSQSPRSINDDVNIEIGVSDDGSPVSGVLVTLSVNGITSEATSNSDGIATFNLGKLAANLYAVTAQAGGCAVSEAVFLPIYDPNGGFVTGEGWIESPAGASKLFPDAVGRANFGFNAKYKTGKNNTSEVDGHTNFQFKAGDLHFSSLLHHNLSLVVSGAKATYTGEGTINGIGSYEFRLIALDGDLIGSTTKDKFRIKIWTKGSPSDVVYDNERLASESADASTVIAGGSIMIHKPKAGGKTAETTQVVTVEKPNVELTAQPVSLDILGNLAVAPNPVKTEAKVRFSLIEDAAVNVRLYDFNGREIYNLYSGNAKANEVYEVGFQRNNLMSGVYIIKLTTDRGNSYNKQVIIE